jgi:septum site-determining protein MinD
MLSGKGGVGKTTSAINLAAGLHYFGQRTIVIDGNLTTPNIGIHLGTPNTPVSIHSVLKGKHKIQDAVYRHHSGIEFIPGSLALDDVQNLKTNNLRVIKKLNADSLIIDGAAGLGKEALSAIEQCDDLIIITNPELAALTDAYKTIKVASELNVNVLGVLVTRSKKDNLDISIHNIETMLEKPVLGVIPEDDRVRESQALKDSIIFTHPQSDAAQAYLKLAASMTGREYEEIKLNWIDKFFKIFRRN